MSQQPEPCTCGRPLVKLSRTRLACRSCGKVFRVEHALGVGWLTLVRDPLALVGSAVPQDGRHSITDAFTPDWKR